MEQVLTIKIASVNDISIIRELAEKVWPKTYSDILTQEQIGYMMDLIYSERSLKNQVDAGHQFIIAYNSETPAGFASYNEIEKDIYKLQKIYVLSGEQGRGTGRYILDYIISDIKSKKAKFLRLNVNRFNKARSFYEKLGFSVIATEDIDIGNGFFMNDYIMQKSC